MPCLLKEAPRLSAVSCVALAVINLPLQAGPIVPTAQQRSISSWVMVPPCGGTDNENLSAADFLDFEGFVDAVKSCATAEGVSTAAQSSQIGSSVLRAYGTASSIVSATSQTVIHSFPACTYQVTFTVQTPVEYTIDGTMS